MPHKTRPPISLSMHHHKWRSAGDALHLRCADCGTVIRDRKLCTHIRGAPVPSRDGTWHYFTCLNCGHQWKEEASAAHVNARGMP